MGAEDAQRIRALEGDMAAAQKELKPLHDGAAGLHKRAGELQKAIDNAGGPPMKKLRALVSQTQQVGHHARQMSRLWQKAGGN